MTALIIKSGDNKRCPATPKYVDEKRPRVVRNQGKVDRAETAAIARLLEGPERGASRPDGTVLG